MKDDQNRPAPIGRAEPKTPAERVQQIQEMQRMMEAAQVAPAAPAAPAAPVAAPAAAAAVNDAFAVLQAQAVKAVITDTKVNPAQQASYGKVQADVASLFGGKGGVELKGEPWKIISFLDAAPALFTPKKPLASYEPLVPKSGIVTREGTLLEVGLKSKDASEPTMKKRVLLSDDGKLKGAECKSPDDLKRLLQAPGFFERVLGSKPAAGWEAKESASARFEVKLAGPKAETLYFNNFGLKVPAASSRSAHDFIANYHLDHFGAAI